MPIYLRRCKHEDNCFTSNQPRHLHLIKALSEISEELYAIQECKTLFPGKVKDFYEKTEVMQEYFTRVKESEHNIFGNVDFLPTGIHRLAIKYGDLSKIDLSILDKALHSDVYVVFGASYIMDELVDFLVENKAINIHMGISPYYRGCSCNFWAPYDSHPEMIGATVHYLSKGLDDGDMLYHALPKPQKMNCFDLGMESVRVAHNSLVERIANGEVFKIKGEKQDKSHEIKYARNSDFTDSVALDYLNNQMDENEVYDKTFKKEICLCS